jgi:hypothetical protein
VEEFMPIVSRCLSAGLVALAFGLSTAAQAQGDEFMRECRATASQKMCECMSAKIPPDKRAAAVVGLRKSNAAVVPGAAPVDPAQMTQEQMQGLDAVIAAQSYCMG